MSRHTAVLLKQPARMKCLSGSAHVTTVRRLHRSRHSAPDQTSGAPSQVLIHQGIRHTYSCRYVYPKQVSL